MVKKKALLILGPSFRRNTKNEPLAAIERFDGLFFRIARKYLKTTKDVDTAVMLDDLTLVDGTTSVQYTEAEGAQWGGKKILKNTLENSREKNRKYLTTKLKSKKYSEVFLSIGKEFAKALPDFNEYGVKVIFPTNGGLGPKAQALKEWLSPKSVAN